MRRARAYGCDTLAMATAGDAMRVQRCALRRAAVLRLLACLLACLLAAMVAVVAVV